MREIPLQLIRSDRGQRPTTAWLIPGAEPLDWLTEIACWPVKHEELRCVALPRTDTSEVADGLLVLLTEPLPETDRPHGCQPYGLLAKNLYVPVEATVTPPLTNEEWQSILIDPDRITVWRATGEFVGFDPADVLLVTDLLTAEVNLEANWTAAREAPAPAPRLRAITSSAPVPTMEDISTQWDHEIGSKQAPQTIPPQPGEPPPTWSERFAAATAGLRRRFQRLRQSLSRGLAPYREYLTAAFGIMLAILLVAVIRNLPNGINWNWWTFVAFVIASLLMATLFRGQGSSAETAGTTKGYSGSPARASGFWTWLQGAVSAMKARGFSLTPFQDADQRQREREVKRLLRMLEENPDEGLRYAIPFGGDAGRGTAATGNQLVARDPFFSMGGGGGAVDNWDISAEQQLRLIQSYRLLAEREQRAGRHRRAAYIYSHLLNDWGAAANVLAAGRQHAEAAVIYEKRLQNIPEAARQYELAGQTDTALKLYVATSDWFAAAELCNRVDRPDDARKFYRQAVDATLRAGNIPRAAELLEQKLEAVDEAFDRLQEAWPTYACADACFDAWFDLAARHHRNDAALTRVEALTHNTSSEEALRLMPRLQRLHQRYPQAAVQHQARESSFQLIARHLTDAPAALAQSLTSFLPALASNDRLLSRDCQRYVENCRTATPKKQLRLTYELPQLRCRHKFHLSDSPLSLPVYASQSGWIVLTERTAEHPQDLILTSWEKVVCVNSLGRLPIQTTLVAIDPVRREIWLSSSRAAVRLEGTMDTAPWEAISPSWLPGHTVRVLPRTGAARVLWFDDHGAAWLSECPYSGTNVRSFRVAEEWLGDPQLAVRLMRGKAQLLERADGAMLTCLPVGSNEVFAELFDRNQVRVWSGLLPGDEMICSPKSGSLTALILGQDQVMVMENFCRSSYGTRIHTGWDAPCGMFLIGDMYLLADHQRIAIYRQGEESPLIEHTQTKAFSPMAVAPCGVSQFSILRCNGAVEVWEY